MDPPGRLHLHVLLGSEQVDQAVLLLVGKQAGSGMQGPPCTVERVVLAAAVTVGALLDPAPAPVQGVTGQTHDVEGVHHRYRAGQFLGGGGLEPGEPVNRDHLDRVTPSLCPLHQPVL